MPLLDHAGNRVLLFVHLKNDEFRHRAEADNSLWGFGLLGPHLDADIHKGNSDSLSLFCQAAFSPRCFGSLQYFLEAWEFTHLMLNFGTQGWWNGSADSKVDNDIDKGIK